MAYPMVDNTSSLPRGSQIPTGTQIDKLIEAADLPPMTPQTSNVLPQYESWSRQEDVCAGFVKQYGHRTFQDLADMIVLRNEWSEAAAMVAFSKLRRDRYRKKSKGKSVSRTLFEIKKRELAELRKENDAMKKMLRARGQDSHHASDSVSSSSEDGCDNMVCGTPPLC